MSVKNEETLLDLITAAPSPYSPALLYDDGEGFQVSLKHGEFFAISDQIHHLLEQVPATGRIVSICLSSAHFLIPCLFVGILRARAVFMYLDCQWPMMKRNELLQISSSEILLTDSEALSASGWRRVKQVSLVGVKLSLLIRGDMLPSREALTGEPEIAYVVFTSGSTGQAKLVRVPHSCIVPNIVDLRDRLEVSASERILVASPFSFDPSVVDVFLALSTGACLVLVHPRLKAASLPLARAVHQYRVTFMQATPSLFLRWAPAECAELVLGGASAPLRVLLLGGEPFPPLAAVRARRHPRNRTRFFNVYGVTEVSSWATIAEVRPDVDDEPVPLGQPMKSTQIRLVDEQGRPLTEPGCGRLQVGGERFCLVDGESAASVRPPVFRDTGDAAEWRRRDGAVVFGGRRRTDGDVKRWGQRLSLAAVERLALESRLVWRCCAAVDDRTGRLVLAACADPSVLRLHTPDEVRRRLRRFFRRRGRPAEVPDWFELVADLPLSRHGKADRQTLLEQVAQRKAPDGTDWNEWLASAWMELTDSAQEPSADSRFLFSGGDSMAAVELARRVEDRLDAQLPQLLDVVLNRTWAEVRDLVARQVHGHRVEEEEQEEEEQEEEKKEVKPKEEAAEEAVEEEEKKEVKPKEEAAEEEEEEDVWRLTTVWRFDLAKCVDSSPLIIGSTVVVGSHSGRLCALSVASGRPLWTTQLADRVESTAAGDADGRRLFVGCYDGGLHCLDAVDGAVLWTLQTGDQIRCSPTYDAGRVYCGSHDRHVYCADAGDGRLLWKTTFSPASVVSRPCLSRGRLLAAGLDGTCCALDAVSGRVLWRQRCPKPVFGGLVTDDALVIIPCVDGSLYARCVETGRLVWRFECAGPVFSTPRLVAADAGAGVASLAVSCHGRRVYRVDDAAAGSPTWRSPRCSAAVYASPVVWRRSDGAMLLASASTDGRLDVRHWATGRRLAAFRLAGDVFSSPAVSDDGHRLVVGCRDNFVYCLQLDQPPVAS